MINMVKKAFNFSDYWAQQIIRAETKDGDRICALVRRKYSDDDVERVGPGEYIGLQKVEIREKITDLDPDSETFGKRIDKPNTEPSGTHWRVMEPFNEKTVTNYKKLFGVTNMGKTELIFKFKEKTYTAKDEDDFWNSDMKEAKERYLAKKQLIVVKDEQSHNNPKPKKS